MLESLTVENYAVVQKTELRLERGMSAITGETGAGKSIAIDALELALGGRADARSVRTGTNAASICAVFSLADVPRALAFLREKDLLASDDDNDLCIIRRSISKDGRSRAYINDRTVNITVLRELASMLVNIHGQHDGQLLLRPEHQIAYLDAFASLGPLVSETGSLFHTYSSLKKELCVLAERQNAGLAEYKLLHYQIAELEKFAPKEGEYQAISDEADKLNHISTLINGATELTGRLNAEDGLMAGLNNVQNKLNALLQIDSSLKSIADTLEGARLTIEDTASELEHYSGSLELDPERAAWLNERLEQYTTLARKYSVPPQELYLTLDKLQTQAGTYTSLKDEIEACTESVRIAKTAFTAKALELSKKRHEAADEFATEVASILRKLSMPNAVFKLEFSETAPQDNGLDAVTFLFSANLGMEPDLISRTASGGEISRIALAILVLTANKISAPTLIFDEIDTGISGHTAAVTGSLLRKLGLDSQVITVTHLPQVAASAHHQFEVLKTDDHDITSSSIRKLDAEGRMYEIARLLGGSNISETALANARELLNVQATTDL